MNTTIHPSSMDQRRDFLKGSDGRLHLFWRVFLYTLVQALIYTFIHSGLQVLLYNKLHVWDIVTFPLDALIHLALVALTTYLFWRYVDKRPWRGWQEIGLIPLRAGLPFALRGVLFICVIAAFIYSSFVALGWMHILSFNPTPIVFLGLFLDMVPRLIDEPLCEEPAMRGYVYSTLNTCLPRWLALLCQVGLFTLFTAFLLGFGALIAAVQGQPFPYPLGIIVLYFIAIALFGCLLQLCRLITGNLWMGIGLHLFAIEFSMNVVTPYKTLFQIKFIPLLDSVEQFHTFVDVPEICIFVLALVVLLGWISLHKGPMNWRGRVSDETRRGSVA